MYYLIRSENVYDTLFSSGSECVMEECAMLYDHLYMSALLIRTKITYK